MQNNSSAVISFNEIDNLYDALLVNTITLKVNAKLFEYNGIYYLQIKPNMMQMQEAKKCLSTKPNTWF